ncbi:hypothetical protein SISSUDRAFT_1133087 [Sistotremastrum suecicum HHB10207 ss-3]|uniref:F-box domain-containing protein n=1 Tax=Sistotremastrum suecicum HHB10207 ss-3 TaxID=1314776 RepID=A0A165XV53_9AGAM|nr:hypothetical protein SISSUDRAFT_1133087 [Sistotremastrum suecicum HHB10207 ss-3]
MTRSASSPPFVESNELHNSRIKRISKMTLHNLPTEVISMILRFYEDELEKANAKERLRRTLVLGQIDRRLRAIAISETTLWSTIYLTWSKSIVDLYLQRSQDSRTGESKLSVYLDTRASGTSNRKANQKRWREFFTSEMANIRRLEMQVHAEDKRSDIINAINVPAPHLEVFILHLDATVDASPRLFNDDAPALHTAFLHTGFHHNLAAFPSLRTFRLKVGPSNSRKILEMLQDASSLTEISLLGMRDRTDLPPSPDEKIVLTACSVLSLRHLESSRVRFILSNISLPQLERLTVVETIVPSDGVISPFSISTTLPMLPSEAALGPRTTLYLLLHSHRFAIEIRGYRYEANWEQFRNTDLTRFLEKVISAITSPSRLLRMKPCRLVICNNITFKQRSRRYPLVLVDSDQHQILCETFATYSSIQHMKILGDITPIENALLSCARNLPVLAVIQTSRQLKAADADSLARICKKRPLWIEHY